MTAIITLTNNNKSSQYTASNPLVWFALCYCFIGELLFYVFYRSAFSESYQKTLNLTTQAKGFYNILDENTIVSGTFTSNTKSNSFINIKKSYEGLEMTALYLLMRSIFTIKFKNSIHSLLHGFSNFCLYKLSLIHI